MIVVSDGYYFLHLHIILQAQNNFSKHPSNWIAPNEEVMEIDLH